MKYKDYKALELNIMRIKVFYISRNTSI